jgi:hypothetical protein
MQAQVATETAEGRNYEFANGRWFDGQKFVSRRFYSASGVLTAKRPARVERVFDLAGKYVIPPFGLVFSDFGLDRWNLTDLMPHRGRIIAQQ